MMGAVWRQRVEPGKRCPHRVDLCPWQEESLHVKTVELAIGRGCRPPIAGDHQGSGSVLRRGGGWCPPAPWCGPTTITSARTWSPLYPSTFLPPSPAGYSSEGAVARQVSEYSLPRYGDSCGTTNVVTVQTMWT